MDATRLDDFASGSVTSNRIDVAVGFTEKLVVTGATGKVMAFC